MKWECEGDYFDNYCVMCKKRGYGWKQDNY